MSAASLPGPFFVCCAFGGAEAHQGQRSPVRALAKSTGDLGEMLVILPTRGGRERRGGRREDEERKNEPLK